MRGWLRRYWIIAALVLVTMLLVAVLWCVSLPPAGGYLATVGWSLIIVAAGSLWWGGRGEL